MNIKKLFSIKFLAITNMLSDFLKCNYEFKITIVKQSRRLGSGTYHLRSAYIYFDPIDCCDDVGPD